MNVHRAVFSLIGLLGAAALAAAEPITPTKPIVLFNGRDLSGWKGWSREGDAAVARTWSVENGVEQNRATRVTVQEGHICLQAEGAAVEFRNVKLEPLPR